MLQQFEVYHYTKICAMKSFYAIGKVFLLTKTIAKVERRIADKAFLYKELTISIIPFIICIATFAMWMQKLDKAFQILTNGFSGKFESEIPSTTCLSFVIWFSRVALRGKIGANIAGATRTKAATLSGASKYVSTATRQPAECLISQFFFFFSGCQQRRNWRKQKVYMHVNGKLLTQLELPSQRPKGQ